MKLFSPLVLAILLGMPAIGACQAITGDPDKLPVPATPRSAQRLLVARPFTVQKPFVNDWSADQREYTSGTLVVLEMDRSYLVPRNATLGPTLFAGDVPIKRLNHGHQSGRVIGIVPGAVDLSAVPLWFGTPELVTPDTPASALLSRRDAERGSQRARPAEEVRAARRPAVAAEDLAALLRTVGAELVLQYSPQEKDLAEIWRLPTAKPPPPRRED